MNREELAKYKKELKTLEERLEKELKETPEIINFGDQVDAEEDEADESVAANEQTGIRDGIRGRLESTRIALHKIASEEYGFCEECTEPIEKEILDIAPESGLCKKHKLQK